MNPAEVQHLFALSGQRAVVTGASRGIGARAAQVLDAAGASVALIARSEADLREVAATLANEPLVIVADLGDRSVAARVGEQLECAWDSVDILVNNAGLSRPKAAIKLTLSDWDDVLDINLRAAFSLSQTIGVGMLRRQYGRIINVASVLGLIGDAWAAPYSASKSALIGLTRSLAVEWGAAGVTVNALCPGWIDTDMVKDLQDDPAFEKRVTRRTPVRRWGHVGDLDAALLLLASPNSSFLTGQTIVVDGGLTASW
jgi:NAD(P)-dependent dehydrogenase (short-subunit alcohol dehydrogenase family)